MKPFLTLLLLLPLTACTVRLAAPEEPIVINLNVKIEHEIRLADYLRGKTNLPDYLRQKSNLHCV